MSKRKTSASNEEDYKELGGCFEEFIDDGNDDGYGDKPEKKGRKGQS